MQKFQKSVSLSSNNLTLQYFPCQLVYNFDQDFLSKQMRLNENA